MLLRLAIGGGFVAAGWAGWVSIVAAPLLTVMIGQAAGCYRVTALRDPVAPLGRLLAAWTVVVMLLAAGGFLLEVGGGGARWLTLLFVAGAVLLVSTRSILSRLVARWTRQGRLDRRAVIVGGGEEAAALIAALAARIARYPRLRRLRRSRRRRARPIRSTARRSSARSANW